MLDDGKLSSLVGDMVEIDGQALSLTVVGIVARRMGMIDENTSYADTRAWLASDSAEVERLLKTAARLMKEHAAEGADVAAAAADEAAAPFYAASGVVQTEAAALATAAAMGRLDKHIDELCRIDVLGIVGEDGRLLPFAEAYKECLDGVIRSFVAGGSNVHDDVKKAAQRLAESGLRVQYADGRKVNVYSAARQDAMDGVARAVTARNEAMGAEFGADGVEVSMHSMCAPDHLPHQGKRFARDEFERLQETLPRKIACGRNCRHTVRPVLLGVSYETTTEAQRRKAQEDSIRKVSYTDSRGVKRTMTAYEGAQKMRQWENEARKAGMKARTLENAGVDASDIRAAIKEAKREYARRCKEMGITPQVERMDIYELSGD